MIKNDLTEKDFIEMEALEKRYYSEEFIADYKDAYDWYRDLPFTTVAAEDNGRIVGFLELFPISDRVYKLLLEGRFNDKYLEKRDIVDIEKPCTEPLNLFLSCIVVDRDYRGAGVLALLLRTYADLYEKVVRKGYVIDKVITDNVTKEGESFSLRMGFERLTKSDHGSVVYIQDFEHFMEVIRTL